MPRRTISSGVMPASRSPSTDLASTSERPSSRPSSRRWKRWTTGSSPRRGSTRTSSPSIVTWKPRASSANGSRVQPVTRSKRAWCQWQVTRPDSTVPWGSGKPMWGQRSSIAQARSSLQKTTTGRLPTLVSSRPVDWSSASDPAHVGTSSRVWRGKCGGSCGVAAGQARGSERNQRRGIRARRRHATRFGVGAHLEEGGGLHPAGELGVGDLVGPGAEGRARAVDLQEEVGVAAPGGGGTDVEERGLVDDVGAGLHGLLGVDLGGGERGDGVVGILDLDDVQTLGQEAGELLLLVFAAAAGEDVEHGVFLLGALTLAAEDR